MIKVRDLDSCHTFDLVMLDRTRNLVVVENEELGRGELKLDRVEIIETNERSDTEI